MKSLINECWIKAARYGNISLRQTTNNGRKIIVAVIIEWVGPRCSKKGSIISISGATESVRIKGMFIFVFVASAVSLLRMYPRAKCPTANDLFSSVSA